ncbi:hypothetical protein BP5796_08535 [Coleophoma crateriformis]|uniref:Ribonucleases P/MRP subunit Pop8-like domain-containing protein n=1 Tax=Coleophoma crateriformis TaxID=565419 RepID=A0A3D8R898_9HELO|nr:hypothetical protein BP5796_08535 [Coleophoma crateriformis]
MGASSDISMEDAAQGSQETSQKAVPKGHEIRSITIKAPPFSYIHLELIDSSSSPRKTGLDDLTVKSFITAALTQFLGLTGSAISVDILKVEERECWIRVPREDLSPVVAALGGWVGGDEQEGQVAWRVRGKGSWLNVLVANKDTSKIWEA